MLCVAAACAGAGIARTSSAQPVWSDVPVLTTQDPSLWRSIFRAGFGRVVHAVMLGDSQETSPQGRGDVYMTCLHKEFASIYGTSGATPWLTVGESYGGGAPHADWLARGDAPAPGFAGSSSGDAHERLPRLPVRQTSLPGGRNANADQQYGWLMGLSPDARFTPPGAEAYDGSSRYMETAAGVFVELIARRAAGSGEFTLRVTPSANVPTFYAPTTRVLTTALALDDATGGYVRGRFGPISWPAGQRLQVEVYGTSRDRVSHLMCARFVSVSDERGLAITGLAAGGYTIASLFANHGDSGPALAALQPEFVAIAYGANDSGQGRTPTEFRQQMLDLITWIRAATRADMPVMIVTDPYRDQPQPPYFANFDRYAGVAHEFALADPRVLALNSRRLTEEAGWNQESASEYLIDTVHYSALGGRTKARVEVDALRRAFVCLADFNADGFVDYFDFDDFAAGFESGVPRSDVNVDGFIDFFDFDEFVEAFEAGC